MKRVINPALPNLHHIIIAQSGGGKTTWLKRRPEVKGGRRVIAWDPDHEYDLERFTSFSAFLARVRAAGSGRLRIALSVDATAKNFARFCAVVWGVSSADRPTLCIVEELADVTTTAKAGEEWGTLIRRARKYGTVLYVVTQRPAECDKTVYSQCANRWVGFTETDADQKRAASAINKSVADVAALKPLEYYYKTAAGTQKGRVLFKKPAK